MILEQMMNLVNTLYFPRHQMRGYTVQLRRDLFDKALMEFKAKVQIVPWEIYQGIKMKNVVFIPRKEK